MADTKRRLSVYDRTLEDREKLIRELNRQLELRDNENEALAARVADLEARLLAAGIP